MRVIAGRMRGLKLNPPKDDRVRPTTDRVKESLFNVISEYVYDANVLDLFAGSGALGIEAISRGAKKAYFCDMSRDSISVVKSNLEKARIDSEAVVINSDYKDAISRLSRDGVKFDIIFLDPPYYKGLFEDVLNRIQDNKILDEEGIVVAEHDAKDDLSDIGNLKILKEKKYGITKLTIYYMGELDEKGY